MIGQQSIPQESPINGNTYSPPKEKSPINGNTYSPPKEKYPKTSSNLELSSIPGLNQMEPRNLPNGSPLFNINPMSQVEKPFFQFLPSEPEFKRTPPENLPFLPDTRGGQPSSFSDLISGDLSRASTWEEGISSRDERISAGEERISSREERISSREDGISSGSDGSFAPSQRTIEGLGMDGMRPGGEGIGPVIDGIKPGHLETWDSRGLTQPMRSWTDGAVNHQLDIRPIQASRYIQIFWLIYSQV